MRQPSELEVILDSASGQTVLAALLQTTPSIAVIADTGRRILRVSHYACELSGLRANEMEGLTLEEFIALVEPRAANGRRLKAEEFPLAQALEGRAQFGREGFFRNGRGQRVPIVSNVAPMRNSSGEVIGAISSVTDLRAFKALEAQLRAAVSEREMLYRELAHGVKNHLQVISGLVALEARDRAPEAKAFAERISHRLQVLAAVYRSMIQTTTGGRIDVQPLLEQAVQPYRSDTVEVVVISPAGASFAPDHAGPIGMLVNEAACNSYKHAFPDRRGRITVALRQRGLDDVELEIADDGVGIGPGADRSTSQGIRLMRLLAKQLGGKLTISAGEGGGARVVAHLNIGLLNEQGSR